jgi:predicted XRE-type DNA-binding protein
VSNAVEYRFIARLPTYKFGSDGSVWTVRRNLRMKTRLFRGAPTLSLYANGKHQTHFVSRLIAEAFHGPCPQGLEVRHFPDRDQTNNRPENLVYGTHKQNIADQVYHGTRLRGERAPTAKLNDKQVIRIKRLYASRKRTQVQLAAMLSVSQSLISAIVTGVRWAHIQIEGAAA